MNPSVLETYETEVRSNALGRIARLEKDLADARSPEYLDLQLARGRNRLECAEKLKEAGFDVEADISTARYGTDLKVEVADLPRLYRAVGRVKLSGKGLVDQGDRKKAPRVRVHLSSERYPSLRVSYEKPLPRASKKAPVKCKIVKRVVRELVCSV